MSVCSAIDLLYSDASANLKSLPRVRFTPKVWEKFDFFQIVNP
jgi:hypothetical protein